MAPDHSDFIAKYDREITGDFARSFYGDSGFYNIGDWRGMDPTISNMVAACEALVQRLADTDSDTDKTGCKDILDVACGLGATTASLARTYPNAAVHGSNISEVQIKAAQDRCPSHRMTRPSCLRRSSRPLWTLC